MEFIKKNIKKVVLLFLLLLLLIGGIFIMKNKNPYSSEGIKGFGYRVYYDGKWSNWCSNGEVCGKKGKVITNIEFKGGTKKDGSLFYSVAKNGVFTGLISSDEKLADVDNNIDGILLTTTNKLYNDYNIYYRTYNSDYKWLKYSNGNDESFETKGINGVNGKGIEMIQIIIIKKDSKTKIDLESDLDSSYGFYVEDVATDEYVEIKE